MNTLDIAIICPAGTHIDAFYVTIHGHTCSSEIDTYVRKGYSSAATWAPATPADILANQFAFVDI